MALEMLTTTRLLDLTSLTGVGSSQNESESMFLSHFLETMETRLMDFGLQISAHYLSRVTATPHFSLLLPDEGIQ